MVLKVMGGALSGFRVHEKNRVSQKLREVMWTFFCPQWSVFCRFGDVLPVLPQLAVNIVCHWKNWRGFATSQPV